MPTRKLLLAGLAMSMAGLVLADEAQRHPDVVGVEVTPTGENRFDFDVTLLSPYGSPSRYADAFRVMGPDGEEFGVRELLYHHANEQPLTRRRGGVEIPAIVQGRHGTGPRPAADIRGRHRPRRPPTQAASRRSR